MYTINPTSMIQLLYTINPASMIQVYTINPASTIQLYTINLASLIQLQPLLDHPIPVFLGIFEFVLPLFPCDSYSEFQKQSSERADQWGNTSYCSHSPLIPQTIFLVIYYVFPFMKTKSLCLLLIWLQAAKLCDTRGLAVYSDAQLATWRKVNTHWTNGWAKAVTRWTIGAGH